MSRNIYIVNGSPTVRIIHQQPILNPQYQRNIRAPPPSHFQAEQRQIDAVEGIEVIDQYEADVGDPVVIEEVVFRGEVVQVGSREKQVIHQNEAIVMSEGYASEDGKSWKPLPKIMMTIFKIGQLSIQQVTKVKAKFDSAVPHHKIMKISCDDAQYYLGFRERVFNEWFLRLIWAKLMIDRREIEDYGEWGGSVSGKVYKKSQILGEWELRYVTISKDALLSSKDDRSSASLQIKDTKQIWTRFQNIKGGFFLVIKLWYGIIKEEFAVPVKEALRWLYHILALLKPS